MDAGGETVGRGTALDVVGGMVEVSTGTWTPQARNKANGTNAKTQPAQVPTLSLTNSILSIHLHCNRIYRSSCAIAATEKGEHICPP